MAPFDGENFKELARKGSRRLVPDLPARVDPVLERLLLGRRRIENAECWVQKASSGLRYCAGLALTPPGDFYADDLYRQAWDYLNGFLPRGHTCVAGFNDASTTKHADVLALFDRAIKAAEG